MATIQDFLQTNNLQWQPTFNAPTDAHAYGYRGSLVITPGTIMSADKQLPPKATCTQTILVTDSEKIDFLACELSTINFFEPFIEAYRSVLSPTGLYILFVTDIDSNGKFEYEGFTFNMFSLDESSVWNELIEYADLEKSELKKASAEEKIDIMYDTLKTSNLRVNTKSYEDMKASQSKQGKILFGAV